MLSASGNALSSFSSEGFIQLWRPDAQATRAEILSGLAAPRARIAPKFFYDALGSRLFEAICALPEYYPTRTEAEIFDRYQVPIARTVGQGSTLIDLGAGNCAKASRLFPALQPAQYVPIDISVEFLRETIERLQQRFPHIGMTAVGMDFSEQMNLPPEISPERRLFFYPGSSIGNFMPEQAEAFLRRLHAACGHDGGLLIGVDLVKETAVLEAAYDDALGVTAAFNLNALRHANALAGTDFNPLDWRHHACFDEQAGRIEMHLIARRAVNVRWEEGERRFAEGEGIHTECSYKYTPGRFLALLERAGFRAEQTWTDARGWFLVCHARAEQPA